MKKVSLALFLGAVLAVANASATSITYSDAASWTAASTGLTTIDFGTLSPPPGSFIDYPSPPGLTIGGVTFTGTSADLGVVSDTFCCSTYARGFDTLDSGPASGIVASLPSDITAVGFYLYTVTLGDVTGSLPGTVTIEVNGLTDVVTTPTAPNLAFFGVTSTSPITTLTITPTQMGEGTAVDVINFAYGQTAPTTGVPEPGSLSLLLLGALSLGLLIRITRIRQQDRRTCEA